MKHTACILLLLGILSPSPLFAQTSQLQREICASSANLSAKVEACSEMLDHGQLDTTARARAYTARADAYGELGKFDLALGDYGRALDLVAFDAFVFHSRAVALGRLGRNVDALKDLDRALMLRPEYGIAYETRARVLLDLAMTAPPDARAAHLAQALDDADRALALEGPDDQARLHTSRGRVRFYLGRVDAAIADFDRALALQPDDLVALSLRGAAFADTGDFEHAIADFSSLLRLKPATRVVRSARAYSYFQSQQYALALADLERVLTEAPSDMAAKYCHGAARIRTGDAGGRAEVDSVVLQRPDIAEAQATVCSLP